MSPAERLVVRPARTSDVRAIRRLVDTYSPERRLLSKATVPCRGFVKPSSLNGTGPQDEGAMSLSSTGMLTGVPWGVVALSLILGRRLRDDELDAFVRHPRRPRLISGRGPDLRR